MLGQCSGCIPDQNPQRDRKTARIRLAVPRAADRPVTVAVRNGVPTPTEVQPACRLRGSALPKQADDAAGAEAARASAVVPARVSASARDKANRKRTAEGWPVHHLCTLLSDLATVVRNRAVPRAPGTEPFEITTRPTDLQKEAFRLLGVRP